MDYTFADPKINPTKHTINIQQTPIAKERLDPQLKKHDFSNGEFGNSISTKNQPLKLEATNLRKRETLSDTGIVELPSQAERETMVLRKLITDRLYFKRLRWLKYKQTGGLKQLDLGFNELRESLGFEEADFTDGTGKAEKTVRNVLDFGKEDVAGLKNLLKMEKYKNKVVIGFSIKRVGFEGEGVSVDRLPKMSFAFNDINYNKALGENDRQLKHRSGLSRKKNNGRERKYIPIKLKKGEIPLSMTARMIDLDSQHKIVLKTECFTNFSDIDPKLFRKVKKTVEDEEEKKEIEKLVDLKEKEIKARWKEVSVKLLKVKKFFGRADTEANAKKVVGLVAKERKKTMNRYKKLAVDYVLRAKKFIKEVQVFYKRKNKEMAELRKKKNKHVLDVQKRLEEKKEQEKQKQRIEFLIKRSSIYAEFMANKIGIAGKVDSGRRLTKLSQEDLQRAKDNVNNVLALNEKKNKEYNELSRQNNPDGQQNQPNIDFSNANINDSSRLIDTPRSFNGKLKSYQLKGLRWLDSLFSQGINGILADEMGLGKTIQAIALLAHLSENKGNWGPFLVIAPAITLFNWFAELQRFCPNLSVLPYWGALKDRKVLRRYLQQKHLGRRDSPFHVIVTSYQIAVSDEKVFHKTKWQYIILDEAQAIKNMNSLRWNTLLSIQSKNKLLLTGTPIQNTMAELWALLHFIMPLLFDSHEQFQEWFSKNIERQDKQKMNQIQLNRLHAILKPFMLRRVKKDVEKEIGKKFEHEVFCELTRRQRELYERIKGRLSVESLFKMRESKDKAKNLMNLVMQFRKVCNHPELFERKQVESSLLFCDESFNPKKLYFSNQSRCQVIFMNEFNNPLNFSMGRKVAEFNKEVLNAKGISFALYEWYVQWKERLGMSDVLFNFFMKGTEKSLLTILCSFHYLSRRSSNKLSITSSSTTTLPSKILFDFDSLSSGSLLFKRLFLEKVVTQPIRLLTHFPKPPSTNHIWSHSPLVQFRSRFPDLSSLINDSAKLRYLDKLLKKLKKEKKRALVFCQMTKMLDILEDFLQFKRHKYFRLDGSCDISDRRDMVNEFQRNSDVFVFLLSTRAGGLGVTLTAADAVIFFDNDWNPTMDAQAADRAHRIGRTEDVHVYNLITKNTVEERIIRRAKHKKEVQKTLYSGETFKANMFKPNEIANLLFEDKDIEKMNGTDKKNEVDGKKKKVKGMKIEEVKKETNGMTIEEVKKENGNEKGMVIEKVEENGIEKELKDTLKTLEKNGYHDVYKIKTDN